MQSRAIWSRTPMLARRESTVLGVVRGRVPWDLSERRDRLLREEALEVSAQSGDSDRLVDVDDSGECAR